MALRVTAQNEREAALNRLTDNLGVPITRVVKWLSETPTYSVWVDEVRVDLGNIDTITSQRKLRNKIAQTTDILPNWIHNNKWDDAAQAFLTAAEHLEVPSTTQLETLSEWIEGYLKGRLVNKQDLTAEEFEKKLLQGTPVRIEGAVYVTLNSLRLHVIGISKEQVSRPDLATALASHGATGARLGAAKKRYWLLPNELLPENLRRAE